MIFRTPEADVPPEEVKTKQFADLGMLERDIEKWVLENPEILGEDLLVVATQFDEFDRTAERPDVLAVDRSGNLVVVELKRDRAENTTDLQAIKYASYCSTMTARDLQEIYRSFHNERRDADLSPEEVGEKFANFVDSDEPLPTSEAGWVEFNLDDKPRIFLAAGSFGPEITTPVIWLQREYGMDITCVELRVFETEDSLLVTPRIVLPIPEAEEYMAKRRKKQKAQQSDSEYTSTIRALLDSGVVEAGDVVVFNESKLPVDVDFDSDDPFWRAEITGKLGQSDNVRWLHDDREYSVYGLTQKVFAEATGDAPNVNGYPCWCHPEHEMQTLMDLRRSKVGDIDW